MVRITERIMKFFRKKKTRIRSTETAWKTYRDAAVQKNFCHEKVKNSSNQEKVIQLLNNGTRNSPHRRIFSHYAPLPAIGTEISSSQLRRPALLRQRTYTVLNPVYVKGPEFSGKAAADKPGPVRRKPVKKHESLQEIKNKYKNVNNFDLNRANKNRGGTAFWFAI